MHKNLTKRGVKVPNGFAVTAYAYNYFLEKEEIKDELKEILKGLDTHSIKNLVEKGRKAREAILKAELPKELREEIATAYKKLCRQYGQNADVAVRSSATAEDLPSISENSHVLVKIDGKPVYDSISNIYSSFGDCKDIELDVIAMDGNEAKWVKAQQIYQHPAKNSILYKIVTETGREIEISENHSLIILDPGSLKPKTISIAELKGNEMVPATKSVPLINSNMGMIDILEYIHGEDIHAEEGLIYIKNKSLNWKIQNPLRRYIKLTADFAYFLGIYCAEGCTYETAIILTNSEDEIIEKIKKFAEQLSLYNNQKINKNSLRFYCKTLVRFLHQVTGVPLDFKGKGKSCRIKKVPNFIFEGGREIIASFLAGCFDGDGYVSKAGIGYCSTSEQLIGGIVKLLEMLDFEFYLRRKNNSIIITIPSSQAAKFKETIFLQSRKESRLNKLISDYNRRQKHPQFKNSLHISDDFSKMVKVKHDSLLERQVVKIYFCLLCDKKIEKTGHYKNKLRFYCKNCKRAVYENNAIKIHTAKNLNYDEKGRFKKQSTPWNKGLISGNISRIEFKKLMKKYDLGEYSDLFEKSIMWDRVNKIEKFEYNGMVYDFTVPNLENFAAGIGGIITHNSASFAGQQETYLNIKGEHALMDATKKCFASLFTNRAISYRADKGFDHFKISLSVGVQKMVRSDKACSGVMFSIDTETGFKDAVLINGSYGLGENVVQGSVNPDQFYAFKPTLMKGYKPIISKKLGSKKIKMVYSEHGTKQTTENVEVPYEERFRFVLHDDEILQLARWACIIEEHYSKKARKFKPMDMEWAKDGISKELFIVQARPETVQSQRNPNVLEEYVLKQKGAVLVTGLSVGTKIGSGKAHVIKSVSDMGNFKAGEVLITEKTDPDWEPIMKIASAIVTNRGGRTAHAAIVARELGIPAIVGTEKGTELVKTGEDVTISCAEGEVGKVYKGKLKFEIHKVDLKKLKRPRTKIMMNVGNPDQAFDFSFIPNDGVGLAREEFIISSYIKVHPLALLHFDRLKDKKAKEIIAELTYAYKNRVDFFIEKLAQGVAMIGAAFYPKDVIVRMSDFKTNEYANLIGGAEFEPKEENPMLGWRGASRYYAGNYREAFGLECLAMKKARDEMGLTNIKLMIPFCRTVDEGRLVIAEMRKYGLEQGRNGLEIYMMAEIPSNVILADEFAKIFDGFSIGSNDLTQLTLGLDRDSELVSRLYDERNPAVKKLIYEVIQKAKKNKRKVGICGQGPSDHIDFAQFLVRCGIDSISLNPDTVIKTTLAIAEMERKLRK
ncbi:phosphoenolpyruvate synthase [Candidatus Woesearchaeota archaeon]|nr:phosphoenolpyruvate synthase [Candidatus Woesearchaeota archaeon]